MKIWEMTKGEYIAFREQGITDAIWKNKKAGPGSVGKREWKQRSVYLHKTAIRNAINDGKKIPLRVIRSYPDYKKWAKGPKYKVGDMVYSYQNPTVKREVNRVSPEKEPGYPHRYRLTLIDKDGNHYNSKWINENSLSKT